MVLIFIAENMKIIIPGTLACLLLISCHNNTKNTENSGDSLSFSKNPVIHSESDTFKTETSGVYFLLPDDQEIEKMQKENSEDDYNEIIADITWYPGVASESLDSFNIHNEYITNQRRLIFVLNDGKSFEYVKDSIHGDMIIFRKDTAPVISHAIAFDIDSTLRFLRK